MSSFVLNYKMNKHLILLKIQNKMDINVDLLQWSINCLIKKPLLVVLKMKIFQTNNELKNYTIQLLENLIKERYTHILSTIFGVQI